MKNILRLLRWVVNGVLFFTLLAFALNNAQEATVHFFFGTQWRAPMVLVVLAAFTAGVVVGALGMVPRWWRQRRVARRPRAVVTSSAPASTPNPTSAAATSAISDIERTHGD